MDPIFLEIARAGGFSGLLISGALLYLGLQVRSLQRSVDGVRQTIGEKVFPRLDDHTGRLSSVEATVEALVRAHDREAMRRVSEG